MASRVVKLYILIVLVIVLILPTIYFISPSFKVTEKVAPKDSSAVYHFIRSSDNYELFIRSYYQSDSLPSLLFLADNPSRANALFELSLIDSLRMSFNLYFPDYRSIGKSERIKSFSAYHLEHYLNDLQKTIFELRIKKLTIIAQGFGALIAQKVAHLLPIPIRKLLLISPVLDYNESARRCAKRLARQFQNQANDTVQVPFYYEMQGYSTEDEIGFFGSSKIFASMEYYKSWFRDTLQANLITNVHISKSGLYSKDELMAVNLPSVTIGLMYSLYKTSFKSIYYDFPVKTHILFGEADVMFNRDFFLSKIDENLISIDSIPNSGYFPYIENRAAFLQVLKAIISHD